MKSEVSALFFLIITIIGSFTCVQETSAKPEDPLFSTAIEGDGHLKRADAILRARVEYNEYLLGTVKFLQECHQKEEANLSEPDKESASLSDADKEAFRQASDEIAELFQHNAGAEYSLIEVGIKDDLKILRKMAIYTSLALKCRHNPILQQKYDELLFSLNVHLTIALIDEADRATDRLKLHIRSSKNNAHRKTQLLALDSRINESRYLSEVDGILSNIYSSSTLLCRDKVDMGRSEDGLVTIKIKRILSGIDEATKDCYANFNDNECNFLHPFSINASSVFCQNVDLIYSSETLGPLHKTCNAISSFWDAYNDLKNNKKTQEEIYKLRLSEKYVNTLLIYTNNDEKLSSDEKKLQIAKIKKERKDKLKELEEYESFIEQWNEQQMLHDSMRTLVLETAQNAVEIVEKNREPIQKDEVVAEETIVLVDSSKKETVVLVESSKEVKKKLNVLDDAETDTEPFDLKASLEVQLKAKKVVSVKGEEASGSSTFFERYQDDVRNFFQAATFEYSDALSLMKKLGARIDMRGRTSGSRRTIVFEADTAIGTGDAVGFFHEPHGRDSNDRRGSYWRKTFRRVLEEVGFSAKLDGIGLESAGV